MSSSKCPVTALWASSPHASRPTTEVEPHEALELMIRGYHGGAHSTPGAPLAEGLEMVLNETLSLFESVNPGDCPLTELHRQAFTPAPGTGIDSAQAFKLLLVGFGLGRHHGSGVELSKPVTQRLEQMDKDAAAVIPAEVVSPERAAIVAGLRERQAGPVEVRDTIPAIPLGVLEAAPEVIVEGAPPVTESPAP